MCGEEIPIAMQTNLAQSIEHYHPTLPIQAILLLIHLFAFHPGALRARFSKWVSGHIVIPVHCTGFIAMQVGTIAGESDEISH